ncbi:MAG: ion channel [Proteobacteria bacterium]|nr:ion channel [Pseudomonadota bacterium]
MKVRLLVLVIVPFLVMLSTVGSYALEFDNLFDSFWWTIVTFTTVGYGDLSPSSVEGRLFGIFVLFMGVVINSAVITLISNWYFHFQSHRDRGLKKIRIRDHVLICSDDPDFILSILDTQRNLYSVKKIIVVSDTTENPLTGTQWKKCHWVSGPGYLADVLNRASVSRAQVAYISYKDDSATTMTAMQIHSVTQGKTRIMALVAHADRRKHLEDVGCDFVLHPYDIYVPLMVKASLSPGSPEWIRQVILDRGATPTIENQAIPRSFIRKTWGEMIAAMPAMQRSLPLALVDRQGVVHTNPLSEHSLDSDERVLIIRPPRDRKSTGEIELKGTAPPKGRILVLSDKPAFIARILDELDAAQVTTEIVVVSELEPFAHLTDRSSYKYRWVHASSFSDEGLQLANAKTARVAFIDHEQDSHTLMAVLRLEKLSNLGCFAIASYRQPGFDKRLRNVGCDFALNANELIAPILTQSARHYGMGTLVEEIISQTPQSESLFVAQLSANWVTQTWSETITALKTQYEYLPVALFSEQDQRLIVSPAPDMPVQPGYSIIFLTLTGNGIEGDIFVPNLHRETIALDSNYDGMLNADPTHVAQDIRVAAEKGDAEAQYTLGMMYAHGHVVDRDPNAAFRYMRKAAKQEHSRALFKLGSFHFLGFGTEVSHQKAVQCLRRAANHGSLSAQKALASLGEQRHTMEGEDFLNHDLLDHLKQSQKAVYLKSIIKMILIHGRIGVYEQGYFKEAVHMTRNSHLAHEIEQAIMFGEELKIEATSGLTFMEQKMILDDLSKIALADYSFSRQEQEFIKEVGGLIQADPAMIDRTIERAKYASVQYRDEGLQSKQAVFI